MESKTTSRIASRSLLLRSIRKSSAIYTFVLPGLMMVLVFRYLPLFYLQIAFRNYRPTRAFDRSEWVGFVFFQQLFDTPGFWRAFRNTLIIASYQLAAGFPVPIILSLLLNEIRNLSFKKVVQTVLYLPHFISWVVIASILFNLTSIQGGLFNEIRGWFGLQPHMFMADRSIFRGILVGSGIWKSAGWGTIIYLATISRISPELYESATIDGASRLQKMVFITLPGISDVIVILLILNIGSFLSGGFEQILVMQNASVMEVSDVLGTFVYRTGLLNNRYSYAAAAGLFRSVVATFLVAGANFTAKRMGREGII